MGLVSLSVLGGWLCCRRRWFVTVSTSRSFVWFIRGTRTGLECVSVDLIVLQQSQTQKTKTDHVSISREYFSLHQSRLWRPDRKKKPLSRLSGSTGSDLFRPLRPAPSIRAVIFFCLFSALLVSTGSINSRVFLAAVTSLSARDVFLGDGRHAGPGGSEAPSLRSPGDG